MHACASAPDVAECAIELMSEMAVAAKDVLVSRLDSSGTQRPTDREHNLTASREFSRALSVLAADMRAAVADAESNAALASMRTSSHLQRGDTKVPIEEHTITSLKAEL